MDIVHERAAGMDISKRDAKVCVRVPGTRAGTYTSKVTSWGATTGAILELREFLEREHVTVLVMEATSDYWKPFFYLLEETLPVMLVNAKAARNIPGRKTDVSDAAWLAQLAAHGLLRASFVPPEPIRDLRDLTRARAIAVRDRAREIQRLEKFLESSGIKLSSVVSDLTGVSSRDMLEALINGERNPEVLAGMARGTMRSKIPALVDALTGRFRPHHAFMARLHLDQIDAHNRAIDTLTGRIEEAMEPFREAREALATIPGVSQRIAEVIIAETGADMDVFETPARLASWAGVCPTAHESAGHIKSSHIMPGNKYLKAALGTAAMSAARSKDTYLAAKYRRITARSGKNKALVAVEHSLLTAAWHMLRNGECYTDPGADHFNRINPTRAKNNAIKQLNNLGYNVTITPANAA
ncbi:MULTISPECIES: IS110 family transposase [Paenarthrobacter]|uniref:IS110 family transposase n=1 Tax=Paenarthrobacter TaxID=1742992 RepID=UPI00074D3A9F|nr:IS110 family transposase [Paenarthrobacter ureafaciens]AMB39402.1 transposase [Arthrobacter sp. ATCC 21022]KUR63150.1 transposase [Arthrobacter sp. ATCC 21022]RWW95631.1 IS110 family transposase [Paenarthrobacter ureafaciens]